MIDFFNYKWKWDRNFFIKTEEDLQILEELPEHVKMGLYKDFIYTDFLKKFRKLFQFKHMDQR